MSNAERAKRIAERVAAVVYGMGVLSVHPDEREAVIYKPIRDAVLAELPPESAQGWLPIETAPKNGRHILAADFSGGVGFGGEPLQSFQCVVHWWEWCDGTHREEWGWYPSTGAGDSGALTNLTHWQPLQELDARKPESAQGPRCPKCGSGHVVLDYNLWVDDGKRSQHHARCRGCEYELTLDSTPADFAQFFGPASQEVRELVDEKAWLCENGEVSPSYITVEHGMFTWTKDSLKALRLARRADAEMIAEMCDDVWHVREHMWCGSKARGVVRCLNCSKPIPYTQGTCPHCGKTEF